MTITDIAGRGFDKEETYSVAASSFIYTGGDTYHAFGNVSDAEKPIPFGFDYEALTSYLVEGCNHVIPDAYAQPQGRITITGLQ